MIQLSIILAFILSALASPGGKLLSIFISLPTMNALSPFEKYALLVSFQYIIPSITIYITLRLLKIDTKLRFNNSTKILFGIAIAIYIFIIFAKFYASLIPGGGAIYAVSIISKYFIFPAWGMMIIGILLLINSSCCDDFIEATLDPISKKEYIAVFSILLLPILLIISMYMSPSGKLSLARISQKSLENECKLAVESITEYPVNVTGIFVDNTGGEKFDRINKNNEYYGYNSGMWGNSLYRDGNISFYETVNTDKDKNEFKYKYYDKEFPRGKKTNKLQSNYGIYWKLISKQEPQGSDVKGTTITVVNLENNQPIATTTYFSSLRLRKVCGHIVDGNIEDQAFIMRVFGKNQNKEGSITSQ